MSIDKKQDDYEVGYGKPPRKTQFQRGRSGNPTGRPKKSLNVGDELLQEAKLPVVINENGQKKRITKFGVIVKQLMKSAMTGSVPAQKLLIRLLEDAHGKAALAELARATELKRLQNPAELTDEELTMIARMGLPTKEEPNEEYKTSTGQ